MFRDAPEESDMEEGQAQEEEEVKEERGAVSQAGAKGSSSWLHRSTVGQ